MALSIVKAWDGNFYRIDPTQFGERPFSLAELGSKVDYTEDPNSPFLGLNPPQGGAWFAGTQVRAAGPANYNAEDDFISKYGPAIILAAATAGTLWGAPAAAAESAAAAAGSNFAPTTLAAFGPSGPSTLGAFNAATSTALTTSVADYAATAVATGGTATALTPFAASLPLASIGSSATAGFGVLDALRAVNTAAKTASNVTGAATALQRANVKPYLSATPAAPRSGLSLSTGVPTMEIKNGYTQPGATPQNLVAPATAATSSLPLLIIGGLVVIYLLG